MATKTHYTGEEPRKNQCLWEFRQLHGRAGRNFRRPQCGTKRNDKIGTAETQTRRTNNRIYTKLRVTRRKSCNNRRQNSDPIPREEILANLIWRVFDGQTVPIVYNDYRNKVLQAYSLELQIQHIAREQSQSQPTIISKSPTPSSSSSKGRAPFKPCRGCFRKFPNFQKREVQQVESPNQDVDNNICFACGKKGHWKKDCQKMKRVTQLHGLYEQLNDEEKELMEQDF